MFTAQTLQAHCGKLAETNPFNFNPPLPPKNHLSFQKMYQLAVKALDGGHCINVYSIFCTSPKSYKIFN